MADFSFPSNLFTNETQDIAQGALAMNQQQAAALALRMAQEDRNRSIWALQGSAKAQGMPFYPGQGPVPGYQPPTQGALVGAAPGGPPATAAQGPQGAPGGPTAAPAPTTPDQGAGGSTASPAAPGAASPAAPSQAQVQAAIGNEFQQVSMLPQGQRVAAAKAKAAQFGIDLSLPQYAQVANEISHLDDDADGTLAKQKAQQHFQAAQQATATPTPQAGAGGASVSPQGQVAPQGQAPAQGSPPVDVNGVQISPEDAGNLRTVSPENQYYAGVGKASGLDFGSLPTATAVSMLAPHIQAETTAQNYNAQPQDIENRATGQIETHPGYEARQLVTDHPDIYGKPSEAQMLALKQQQTPGGTVTVRVGDQNVEVPVNNYQKAHMTDGVLGSNGDFTPAPTGGASPATRIAAHPGQPGENNPTNLKTLAHGQWNGQVSADSNGFASFDTAESGLAAADKNLQHYGSIGVVTPQAIADRWANKGEPPSYVQGIMQSVGVASPDTRLDLSDRAVRAKVIQGIINGEGTMRGQPPVSTGQATGGGGIPGPTSIPGITNISSFPTQTQLATGAASAGAAGSQITAATQRSIDAQKALADQAVKNVQDAVDQKGTRDLQNQQQLAQQAADEAIRIPTGGGNVQDRINAAIGVLSKIQTLTGIKPPAGVDFNSGAGQIAYLKSVVPALFSATGTGGIPNVDTMAPNKLLEFTARAAQAQAAWELARRTSAAQTYQQFSARGEVPSAIDIANAFKQTDAGKFGIWGTPPMQMFAMDNKNRYVVPYTAKNGTRYLMINGQRVDANQ